MYGPGLVNYDDYNNGHNEVTIVGVDFTTWYRFVVTISERARI